MVHIGCTWRINGRTRTKNDWSFGNLAISSITYLFDAISSCLDSPDDENRFSAGVNKLSLSKNTLKELGESGCTPRLIGISTKDTTNTLLTLFIFVTL